MIRKIAITIKDRERILQLIEKEREFGTGRNQEYLKDLEQELKRANIVSSENIPHDSITMNSRILLKDLDLGEETVYTLVYPEDADVAENKISVLAPIGTAILGFREGDIIDWKVPGGIVKIRVEKIIYQPEANGHYDL
ncbi:MAG: nucleoside diphosphate kinase regulator [Peptococcaceae bacterium]